MFKCKTLKRIIIISLILLILVLSLSSCLVTGKTLTEKNNGDRLNLKINDTVEIKLESNPTTGYSWFLNDNVDETVVSITSPEFMESKKDEELVGAGGYEIFTIKAISKGKTDIILNYERSWEEGIEPLETFEITISID
jgi:inhibitor of cysteine peptidase